jgi:hypothetical protein
VGKRILIIKTQKEKSMDSDKRIFNLKSVNADTAPEKELRELVKHLQNQKENRYMYKIGEWAGGQHAISTRNGHFVRKEEVINYLQ